MGIRWKKKSNEKSLMKQFQLRTYFLKCLHGLFIFPYLEIFKLRIFFRKSNELTPARLEPSTSSSFIHCNTQPINVICRWFLCNTNTRKSQVLPSIKVSYLSEFIRDFSSDFFHLIPGRVFFHWTISTLNDKRVNVCNLVLTKENSIVLTDTRQPKAFVRVSLTT